MYASSNTKIRTKVNKMFRLTYSIVPKNIKSKEVTNKFKTVSFYPFS